MRYSIPLELLRIVFGRKDLSLGDTVGEESAYLGSL